MIRRGAIGLGIIVLAAAAIWISFGGKKETGEQNVAEARHEEVKRSDTGPPDLELFLHYEPGTAGESAAAILTLTSQREANRQNRRALAAKSSFYEAPGNEPAEVVVRMDPAEWPRRIAWTVEGDRDASERMTAGQVIRVAPPDQALRFAAGAAFDIVLEISADAKPTPGAVLRASVRLQEGVITSSAVGIPAESGSPFEGAIRAGRVFDLLNDQESLAKSAEVLISMSPDAAEGYWFLGRSLELKGRIGEATSAYENALRKTPHLKQPTDEAPYQIIFKLREIEAKSRHQPGR